MSWKFPVWFGFSQRAVSAKFLSSSSFFSIHPPVYLINCSLSWKAALFSVWPSCCDLREKEGRRESPETKRVEKKQGINLALGAASVTISAVLEV